MPGSRSAWLLFLSFSGLGCLGGNQHFEGGGGDSDSDADSDSDSDGDLDCAALPEGPFDLAPLSGPVAAEDLAFDAEGNVVGSNGTSLMKSPYGGPATVFATVSQQAGLRYLPDGRLVVAVDTEGTVLLVDADGVADVLLAGLAYPNGVAVDRAGFAYVTEKDAGRVRRIDPETAEFTVLVDGDIAEPNGITFSPDYRFLYIAGTSMEGIVYRLPIGEDGTPGELEEWARGVGRGRLDGLACDACGNVYVCDYGSPGDGSTVVHRIPPEGVSSRIIVDTTGEGAYYGSFFANMDWGSGIGGWDESSLYFAETTSQRVYELDIGVPSKPRAYP